MKSVLNLYQQHFGSPANEMAILPPSGSRRKYCRIKGQNGSFIGACGTDADENRAFVTIARHFRSKGIRVPEIIAVSDDLMCYIQEDLGQDQLFGIISKGRDSGHYSDYEESLLLSAIRELPRIQYEASEGLDYSVCFPDREFNGRMIDFDLNYFKYCYLKTTDVEFNESLLQDDFDRFKADLLSIDRDCFMYRDFQARNIMIRDSKPWFIDFQGGRKGPGLYDLASFAWQAKSRFPQDLREKLVSAYFSELRRYRNFDEAAARKQLRLFILLRMLQVLGAYGFRGKFEKKEHFIESIPYALDNLKVLLSDDFEDYPYLSSVLKEVAAKKGAVAREEKKLLVEIFSFSYKKGIPGDSSGNGGGYVFDCRGLHNPGKYPEFFDKTGMDSEVKEFLERRGEVIPYMDNIYGLADSHIDCYLRRGFEHIQFSFGCTGGQHRSVYCAEALARHIFRKYRIEVRLHHSEQGVDKTFSI